MNYKFKTLRGICEGMIKMLRSASGHMSRNTAGPHDRSHGCVFS